MDHVSGVSSDTSRHPRGLKRTVSPIRLGNSKDVASSGIPSPMDRCYVQDISTRLSVARHLRYRGVGLGVTLPAPPPCRGLIVVLDLWASFSGHQ